MAVLIDEALFRSWLESDDALEATSSISQMWAHRIDDGSPAFGLAPAEFHVQCFLVYVGEVGNGGHTQLFYNRGGKLVRTIARGLDEMAARSKDRSLQALGTALSHALSMVPKLPQTRSATQRFVERLRDDTRSELGELSGAVHALSTYAYDSVLRYMREHVDELLRPERGLVA